MKVYLFLALFSSLIVCDDNLFIIRAEFIASSVEASIDVLDGLKTVVSYQYPYHPGVLTYNFDRIDKDDYSVLMFSEMYSNTEVFLSHTNHTVIQKLWPIIFKKENQKYMECIVYGNPSYTSKAILTYLFNTTYLKTTAGYLFSQDMFYALPKTISNPIFITIWLRAKDSSSGQHFSDGVDELSSLETNNATTLHLGERKPGVFEFLMIYKTSEQMTSHLGSTEVPEIFNTYFKPYADSVEVELWLEDIFLQEKEYAQIFQNFGVNVTQKYLDVGYNLHPKADPNSHS